MINPLVDDPKSILNKLLSRKPIEYPTTIYNVSLGL